MRPASASPVRASPVRASPVTARRVHRGGVLAALVAIAMVAASCAGQTPDTGASPNTNKPLRTYVALGSSESTELTFGSVRSSPWDQLVFRHELGTSGLFYDLANPGATLADVLDEQLPVLKSLHPSLVTLWATTGDLTQRVPVSTYRREMTDILGELRSDGVKLVVVATSLPVELLTAGGVCPATGPCRATSVRSGAASSVTPPASTSSVTLAQLEKLSAGYDSAIKDEAKAYGDIEVNASAPLVRAIEAGHQGLVQVATSRGRRASTLVGLTAAGAALVATAFEDAIPRSYASDS